MDLMPATRPAEAPQPALVWCPHPLLATAGRELRYEAFEPGESIAGYLTRLGYDFGEREVFLSVNGELITREEWALFYPKAGDLIAVRARVTDDGGGEKNPIATILSIALIIVAPELAPLLAGPTAAASTIALYQALIIVGGNLLINAMFSPNRNNLSNAQDGSNGGTYALTGQSNRARPYEPLQRVLGQLRVYPDLASQPYTEIVGEDQYQYQVFNFGISDDTAYLVLSDFRIGDTPVSDFTGVEIQESGLDGKLTLFPANVDTVQGGTLSTAVGWVQKTTSDNTTTFAIELAGVSYQLQGRDIYAFEVAFESQYRAVGETAWRSWIPTGQYSYFTHYWSACINIADFDAPPIWVQGGYDTQTAEHTDGEHFGVYDRFGDETRYYTWRWRPYSEIQDYPGGPTRDPAPEQIDWYRTNNIFITSGSRKLIRATYRITVPQGQYEVRMRRITPESDAVEGQSEYAWTQLRSYQPDEGDYWGQKRVAVRIRATGQLNGVLDRFSAIASSRVLAWDGTKWDAAETSNPAWLMLATLRGGVRGTRRAWGCNLPEARINQAQLIDFAAWCDSKALTFNGVIDQKMNCYDMLNAIARCGRGSLSLASGKHGVVWDAPGQPVVQVFGLGNIKADTFAVRWISEKLGDEIVLNFWNAEKNAQDSVRALVPGTVDPVNPVTIEQFGIDNADMAGREANLIAAAQKYRRRFCTFESDFEGQVVARGDVVALSHNLFASTELTAWGYSGRLVAGTATVLTLDRTVVMSATQTNYAAVRFPDGQIYVRPVVYAAGTPGTITLATALPSAPDSDGLNPVVDYVWLFGLDAQGAAKKFKVQDVTPIDDKDVRITVVDENPAYYASEGGVYTETTPAPARAQLPVITNISFAEELLRVGNAFTVRLSIQWDVDGVYDHANVRVLVDGLVVHDSTTSGRSVDVTVPATGTVDLSLLPVHPIYGAGTAAAAVHDLAALTVPPADVPWVTLQGDVVSFGEVADIAVTGYRIAFHYGAKTDWGTASPMHVGLITESPFRLPLHVTGQSTLLIKAVNTLGIESTMASYTVVNLGDAPVANVVETIDLRAASWPGDIVNGARVSGDIAANDATLRMWSANEAAAMWGYESNLMWNTQVWSEMYYLTQFTPTLAGVGSVLTLEHLVEGEAYTLEYRRNGPGPMWTQDSEAMWSIDDTTLQWKLPPGDFPRSMWTGDSNLMWSAASDRLMWATLDGGYETWPGVAAVLNEPYDFRVSTAFGPTRGKVITMTFTVDAPDASEAFHSIAIGSGGTRLPITKDYRSIAVVSGGVENDGGTAMSFTIEDYDAALGPLIKLRDSAGTAVAGKFTGSIQGIQS